MNINKSKVIKLLGISSLDNNIIENILELCEIKPVDNVNSEYAAEDICKFYAKAETYYHEYLPEFYVSELLGIAVNDLLNMNIEYMVMPENMQCLFYDRYPKGKFRYSKYAYNAIQVYKVMGVLSKSVYLKIPKIFAKHYLKSFVFSETAALSLGFSKVNSALFHYYLMNLDIRYICQEGINLYLTDDIVNVLENSDEVFKKYISFYEACELYGYHIIHFLCNEYSLPSYTDNILKYDVVNSDKRYRHCYRESYSFLNKDDVKKSYSQWFQKSACQIFSGLNVVGCNNTKFECDWSESNFNYRNISNFNSPLVSVFEQNSYYNDVSQNYENDPEYENINLLCKVWGLDEFEHNESFESALRSLNINSKIKFCNDYNVYAFAKHYECAAFFNSLLKFKIETLESEEYFDSVYQKSYLSLFFRRATVFSPIQLQYIIQDSKKYVSIHLAKYWNIADNCNYKLHKDYIIYKNESYISYSSHRCQCLIYFYTSKIFELYSSEMADGRAKMYQNLDFMCGYNTNRNLQQLIYDDFINVMFVKDSYQANISFAFLHRKNISKIKICNTLDVATEYWSMNRVIKFLSLDKYSMTLTWAILYNLELTMYYSEKSLYIVAKEAIEIKNCIDYILDEYIPVSRLYNLLHKSHPIRTISEEIVVPSGMFYFLMPEHNKGFYFIKKECLNLLDEVLNERINCDKFLTAAETQGNLSELPSKIPSVLAIHLLHLDNHLDDLDKTHSLYVDSLDYCKRDAVIKLTELQKIYQENYILENSIFDFLKINKKEISDKDNEILNTISACRVPDYIMYMAQNKHIKNDKAYRKEDIIGLRDFFYTGRNTEFDVKINNNISCNVPYQTYDIRLSQLEYKENLEQISPLSAEIWDSFVRLQLSVHKCSEKVMNSKINQHIKALNIFIKILFENKITDIKDFKTGSIMRSLSRIDSKTYSEILLAFFKYAAMEYTSRGIKYKYRLAELYIPKRRKERPDDILPETYSFLEYSNIFKYCNNYYMHIKAAIKEIVETGTCIYASTWFYVMSHLNNAWRSNDFAMFPYIDILDIIQRNAENDYKWYLNNRLTKTEATIIALRIQNNPKIISKTKKYTRFTCSEELLETYTTVYSLLALFTEKNYYYDIGFVNHFENRYNGVNKSQLDSFFSKFSMINFRFKSKKLNKTLLSFIDFLENYYITNDIDIERRQAMLLRSHVKRSSTLNYIRKSNEVFDRLTNMICARGEFGYAYDMMVRSIMDAENKLSLEEITDKIRMLRNIIPNIKDIDTLYGFLNYTHEEQKNFNEYINSLSLEELQTTLSKLYLNHLGSKADKYLSCIKNTCQYIHGISDKCAYCIFHIPSIYSLTVICLGIKEDIDCYQNASRNITRRKMLSKILKKSKDIIWAKQKYGDDILQEILSISDIDFDNFLVILDNLARIVAKTGLILGENKDE